MQSQQLLGLLRNVHNFLVRTKTEEKVARLTIDFYVCTVLRTDAN